MKWLISLCASICLCGSAFATDNCYDDPNVQPNVVSVQRQVVVGQAYTNVAVVGQGYYQPQQVVQVQRQVRVAVPQYQQVQVVAVPQRQAKQKQSRTVERSFFTVRRSR